MKRGIEGAEGVEGWILTRDRNIVEAYNDTEERLCKNRYEKHKKKQVKNNNSNSNNNDVEVGWYHVSIEREASIALQAGETRQKKIKANQEE